MARKQWRQALRIDGFVDEDFDRGRRRPPKTGSPKGSSNKPEPEPKQVIELSPTKSPPQSSRWVEPASGGTTLHIGEDKHRVTTSRDGLCQYLEWRYGDSYQLTDVDPEGIVTLRVPAADVGIWIGRSGRMVQCLKNRFLKVGSVSIEPLP